MTTTRRIVLGSALAMPFIRTAHANPVTLRAVVDASSGHGRASVIMDFLNKLEAASQGQIVCRLSVAAQLGKGHDVIKALQLGWAEIAIPEAWRVSHYVPAADLAQLPAFYGQSVDTTNRVLDGVPGAMVNALVTSKLGVVIPGRWLDLGFVNWYGTHKALSRLNDLKGRRVRTVAAVGATWRARFFGAIPVRMGWPEVPRALTHATLDGVQTTSESCVRAQLWQAGLRCALIDRQALVAAIPMINRQFWATLRPPLRTLVTDLWSANVSRYRTAMTATERLAEQTLASHGVKIITIPDAELAAQRRRMMARQDTVAHEMQIPHEILTRVHEAIAA